MSNYTRLVEKILREDTSGGTGTGMVPVAVNQGNPSVAYLPGSFTSHKNFLRCLNPIKKKWKLKVEEDKDNYNLKIEDALNIKIPREHYKHFNEHVYNISKNSILDLTQLLNEATQEELQAAYGRLNKALTVTLKNNPKVRQMLVLMNYWITEFPQSQFLPTKAIIDLHKFDRDTVVWLKTLKNIYGDDLGSLEMLLHALESGQPLNSFEPFAKNGEYLVGVCIDSEYEKVDFRLDLSLTNSMQNFQSLYTNSKELLAEIEAYKSVKHVGNYIYPLNQNFNPSFFEELKEIINQLEEQ